MRVGVPKEIKVLENRVGLTPASVHELVTHGHDVVVESNAGQGIGLDDAAYREVGATIAASADELFAVADMIVKVKEPQAQERKRLRPGRSFSPTCTSRPIRSRPRTSSRAARSASRMRLSPPTTGGLPLLAPMSEVAGRMAVQAGAHFLEKPNGGRGILLGGVPGVAPGKVVILGGGVVGTHAAMIALGMGADVTVLDRSPDAMRALWKQFGSALKTDFSSRVAIEHHVTGADLVIGGVLIPGASAPKLVSAAMIRKMQPGSVVVDVAIDQGGCFETSRATTHAEPTYVVDGVVHYCVANMPGGVPHTSTFALNNATLPFTLALANKGWQRALAEDGHLRNGLNVAFGKVTCAPVAEALGYKYVPPEAVLQ